MQITRPTQIIIFVIVGPNLADGQVFAMIFAGARVDQVGALVGPLPEDVGLGAVEVRPVAACQLVLVEIIQRDEDVAAVSRTCPT